MQDKKKPKNYLYPHAVAKIIVVGTLCIYLLRPPNTPTAIQKTPREILCFPI